MARNSDGKTVTRVARDPTYYREEAERARRLARVPTDRETQEAIERLAQDYSDVAEDLEGAAEEIRHPELL